jgi:hypothetical protein
MRQKLFLLLILPPLLAGCGHYYHATSTHNVPMFREKNELHASASIAGNDESYGYEAQAAYSLTNHVGIMTNYMNVRGGSETDRDFGKGQYIDFAAGYFHPLNKYTTYEVFGGIAGSNQYHEFTNFTGIYEGAARLRFTKVFIQGGYGLTFDYFNVIGSIRFGGLNFHDISCSPDANQFVQEDMTELKKKTHFIIEPAITVRGGWTYVKAQFQVAYADYLNSQDNFIVEPFHMSFGLYFTIAPRYWKE